MKSFPFIFSLFLLSGVALHAQKTLPDLTLKTLEGKPVRILEYASRHQVTVLSFWATWCAPCKRELDAMTELHPSWTAKYDVQVLAMEQDAAADEVPVVRQLRHDELAQRHAPPVVLDQKIL